MVFDVAWGVDIGRTSLKCVKLRRVQNRVEICDVAVIDYVSGGEEYPGETEIRQALAELRNRHKPKATDAIAVALPGQSTFSRIIKVAPVEGRKFEDVIQYEAANQIPFPITDVRWDYYKVERHYEPGEEVEVGIFAVKHEVVNELMSHFDAAKLHVDLVTSAPLALYNLAVYEMDIPEQAVVVDIGADHTDLVIIDGNRCYVRNLGIAGNDITRALQDEFSISFAEAEILKKEVGKSKQQERVFGVMQPVLRRLAEQVSRSLTYYKRQTGSTSNFEHLVLLGNATKLEGLARFFAETLDMRVHGFFDIMRIDLDKDLARDSARVDVLQEHLPSLAVAMGLALQAIGAARINVDFTPAERKSERLVARKQPGILVAAGLLFLLFLFMWLFASSREGKLQKELALLKQQLGVLKRTASAIRAQKDYGDWAERAKEVQKLLEARLRPLFMLETLNRAIAVSVGPNLTECVPPDLRAGKLVKKWDDIITQMIDEEVKKRINDKVNSKKVWLLRLMFQDVEKPSKPQEGKRRRRSRTPPFLKVEYDTELVANVALIDKGGSGPTKDLLRQMIGDALAEQLKKMVDKAVPPDFPQRDAVLASLLKQYEPDKVIVDPGGNILRMLVSKDGQQETDDSGVDYRYYEVHITWPKVTPIKPAKPTKKEKKK